MNISRSIGLAVAIVGVAWPLVGQSSLSEQRERCDDLRDKVRLARRELDRQETISEGQRKVDSAATDYMRLRGRAQAEIDQAQRLRDMGRDLNGSESYARRQHSAALERYQMQGCSTGGRSTYNYDID